MSRFSRTGRFAAAAALAVSAVTFFCREPGERSGHWVAG
jgi:hypothetical protein